MDLNDSYMSLVQIQEQDPRKLRDLYMRFSEIIELVKFQTDWGMEANIIDILVDLCFIHPSQITPQIE